MIEGFVYLGRIKQLLVPAVGLQRLYPEPAPCSTDIQMERDEAEGKRKQILFFYALPLFFSSLPSWKGFNRSPFVGDLTCHMTATRRFYILKAVSLSITVSFLSKCLGLQEIKPLSSVPLQHVLLILCKLN